MNITKECQLYPKEHIKPLKTKVKCTQKTQTLLVLSAVNEAFNILSNNRNLTVVNLSVFLKPKQLYKHEVHTNILRFETDKLFFPLNSGEN